MTPPASTARRPDAAAAEPFVPPRSPVPAPRWRSGRRSVSLRGIRFIRRRSRRAVVIRARAIDRVRQRPRAATDVPFHRRRCEPRLRRPGRRRHGWARFVPPPPVSSVPGVRDEGPRDPWAPPPTACRRLSDAAGIVGAERRRSLRHVRRSVGGAGGAAARRAPGGPWRGVGAARRAGDPRLGGRIRRDDHRRETAAGVDADTTARRADRRHRRRAHHRPPAIGRPRLPGRAARADLRRDPHDVQDARPPRAPRQTSG